jgi:hypothetical protein
MDEKVSDDRGHEPTGGPTVNQEEQQSVESGLLTEDGDQLLTEDGKPIITESGDAASHE